MSDFLGTTLPDIVAELSVLAYLLVFFAGILTSLGPCNLSMVPVIIGFVGGQKEVSRARGLWLSLFFVLGSSITFVMLGLVAAAVGVLAGPESRILYWIAALVCFLIGLNLLGVWRINFDFMARLQPKRVSILGPLGALLLGLAVGLAGSQCGTPVLAAILGIVMAKGKPAHGALMLFCYGMGRGVPIILAGTFAGIVKSLPAPESRYLWMNRAAGVVLLAVGLYFVWIA